MVTKGLAIVTEPEDIKKDLSDQRLAIHMIDRMTSQIAPKRELMLFLMKVTRNEQKIYKFTKYLDLVMKVEKQREKPMPEQLKMLQVWIQSSLLHDNAHVRQIQRKSPLRRLRDTKIPTRDL